MSDLDVRAVLARHHDESNHEQTVLKVQAENIGERTVTLIACAVLPPAGLRTYSDPPRLEYPFSLGPVATCYDWFDCQTIAELLQEMGCTGVVDLTAVFLEEGGPDRLAVAMFGVYRNRARTDLRGTEHRSDPFAFDSARWLVT
jgi:hypothetical protein